MIIWSRWGILTVLFAMLGVGIGFALAPILNPGAGPSYKGDEIVLPFGFGMVIAALVMWFAVRFLVGTVIDKPQPVVIQRQLAEPRVDANGRTQTVEWAHAVDPETGQVVMSQPVSTFFFIPLRFWPFLLGGVGVSLLITGFVQLFSA